VSYQSALEATLIVATERYTNPRLLYYFTILQCTYFTSSAKLLVKVKQMSRPTGGTENASISVTVAESEQ